MYQPDILFVAKHRLALLTEQQAEGAPDLVVEVLSPATGYYDLTKKRRVYEAAGVQEYWIVDPIEHTVLVLDNIDRSYATLAEAREEGEVASRLLEGFVVDLPTMFAHP